MMGPIYFGMEQKGMKMFRNSLLISFFLIVSLDGVSQYNRFFNTHVNNAETVTLPILYTKNVSYINPTTAESGGVITSTGGADITAKGVCWGATLNPTTSDSHTSDGSGEAPYDSHITGLTGGNSYYVRAYATNSAGTGYGNNEYFTTPVAYTLPTVTTTYPSGSDPDDITVGGNVINSGSSPVTDRGVCWAHTNVFPTLSDNHVHIGSGSGVFSTNVTDFPGCTFWWFRAFATNDSGTSYGQSERFKTGPESSYYDWFADYWLIPYGGTWGWGYNFTTSCETAYEAYTLYKSGSKTGLAGYYVKMALDYISAGDAIYQAYYPCSTWSFNGWWLFSRPGIGKPYYLVELKHGIVVSVRPAEDGCGT